MRRLLGVALCAALALTTPAFAHAMSAGVAEAQLRGDALFVMLAPPAEGFVEQLDGDRDGLISGAEVQANREALRARFLDEFAVSASNGARPELGFFDVGVPVEALPGAPAYVRFTAELKWRSPPQGFSVSTRWPLRLEAVRVEKAPQGGWISVDAPQAVNLNGAASPLLLAPAPQTSGRVPSSGILIAFCTALAAAILVSAAWRRLPLAASVEERS